MEVAEVKEPIEVEADANQLVQQAEEEEDK